MPIRRGTEKSCVCGSLEKNPNGFPKAGQFFDELFGEEEPARDAQAAFVEEELQTGQEVALGDVEAAASRDCVLSAAGDGDEYETAR